jgi:hypothetical protein
VLPIHGCGDWIRRSVVCSGNVSSGDWFAETDGRKLMRGSTETIATTAAISNSTLNAKLIGFLLDMAAHSISP